ncbi:hypothetical protein LINGRAHAP2_LOCUS24839 [Linum grandiflorum]
MVSFFSWNFRGAGGRSFLRAFRTYLARHRPEIAIIVEPRISGANAVKVCRKMGFEEWFRVDARGVASGIWVLWQKSMVSLSLLSCNDQFIHLEGTSNTGTHFLLTAVYASHNRVEREILWSQLRSLIPSNDLPWTILGDFNALFCAADKVGGVPFGRTQNATFIDCIHDCCVADIRFTGPRFTWYRQHVKERLVNRDWTQCFPDSHVKHLSRIKSDQRPIMLCLEDVLVHWKVRHF